MMVKLWHNKGYTLIDVLVSLMIISIFSRISLNIVPLDLDHKLFPYHYLYDQMLSIYENQDIVFEKDDGCIINYPIKFNNHGNVNMAQTISCLNDEYVVELGWGKIKKR